MAVGVSIALAQETPPATAGEQASKVPPPPTEALAAKAYAVLDTHCARCHQTGKLNSTSPARVIDNILDLPAIARNRTLVIPALPDGSPLYTSMVRRTMPADVYHEDTAGTEPTPEEIQAVRDWIQELPEATASCADRPRIRQEDVGAAILKALEAAGGFKSRSLRFFTLAHLHNACASTADLEGYRQGVTKLVNSLSWAKTAFQPVPVDEAKTVLMIDLEALEWVPQHWDRLAQRYAYGMQGVSRLPGRIATLTGTALPLLKADWAAAEAANTELYGELLGLPQTFLELQRILKADVAAAVRGLKVRRIGLRDSKVTQSNRLLERHELAQGSLWLAYDFQGSSGRRNLLEHPLGPQPAGAKPPFRADGLRALFHLPNGFTGFSTYDAAGERTQRTPSGPAGGADEKARPSSVATGGGCLSCHGRGVIAATDELRAFAESDRTHSRETRDMILGLHLAPQAMDRLIEVDASRTAAAFAEVGVDPDRSVNGHEPVTALAIAQSESQTAARVAAELDLTLRELEDRIAALQGDARRLGYRLFQSALSREDTDRLLRALSGAPDTPQPAAKPAVAAAPPAGAPKLDLEIWTDKLRYTSGEVITIFARSSANCNLTVISLDQAGKATVLFPNEFESNSAMLGNIDMRLPGAQAPYILRAREKGPETLIGVCTLVSKTADGIQPDYERQRFTVLGNWKVFLSNALAEEAAERKNPTKAAERNRARGRQKGKAAELRTRPEVQARTAIRFMVE